MSAKRELIGVSISGVAVKIKRLCENSIEKASAEMAAKP